MRAYLTIALFALALVAGCSKTERHYTTYVTAPEPDTVLVPVHPGHGHGH